VAALIIVEPELNLMVLLLTVPSLILPEIRPRLRIPPVIVPPCTSIAVVPAIILPPVVPVAAPEFKPLIIVPTTPADT